MNTGQLLEVSNLLDLGSFTCFLVFWLYHPPAVIQSTGTQRNAGARSISSWQNPAFTSNVGVLGKESTRSYLAFNSPNFCNALALFLWSVQRKTWAYGSTAWTTRVDCCTSSTTGSSQAAQGFKSRASKCIYCSLQASLNQGCLLLSCTAVKSFCMRTSLWCLLCVNLGPFHLFWHSWISKEQGQMKTYSEFSHPEVACSLFISENIMLFSGKISTFWCLYRSTMFTMYMESYFNAWLMLGWQERFHFKPHFQCTTCFWFCLRKITLGGKGCWIHGPYSCWSLQQLSTEIL